MNRHRLLTAAIAALLAGGASQHITASDAALISTTSSGVSTVTAAVDHGAPELTLTDPGATVSGTVILTATATDPEGADTTILIDVAPADTTSWAQLCPPAPGPVSCAWDTRPFLDGDYQVRASATDAWGNTATRTYTVTIANL